MIRRTKYPAGIDNLSFDICQDGTVCFWGDAEKKPLFVLNAQQAFDRPRLEAGQILLKSARQRFVFKHQSHSEEVVIKLFPLSFIGSKLRHPKYAYQEFINTRHAQELELPVPVPIAFLEKRSGGLVCCSGVVQQSLSRHKDLLSMHKENQLGYSEVAAIATPVLIQLYEAGAHHLDLREENIMLKLETGDACVIDWQYASFTDAQAPWLLEYLVAFFIKKAPEVEKKMLLNNWAGSVCDAAQYELAPSKFVDRVNALLKSRFNLKQRSRLLPVKTG